MQRVFWAPSTLPVAIPLLLRASSRSAEPQFLSQKPCLRFLVECHILCKKAISEGTPCIQTMHYSCQVKCQAWKDISTLHNGEVPKLPNTQTGILTKYRATTGSLGLAAISSVNTILYLALDLSVESGVMLRIQGFRRSFGVSMLCLLMSPSLWLAYE